MRGGDQTLAATALCGACSGSEEARSGLARKACRRNPPRRKSTETRENPAVVRRAKAEPGESGVKVLLK